MGDQVYLYISKDHLLEASVDDPVREFYGHQILHKFINPRSLK